MSSRCLVKWLAIKSTKQMQNGDCYERNLFLGSLIAIAQILREHAKSSTTCLLKPVLPVSCNTLLSTLRLSNLLAINLKNSSILSKSSPGRRYWLIASHEVNSQEIKMLYQIVVRLLARMTIVPFRVSMLDIEDRVQVIENHNK